MQNKLKTLSILLTVSLLAGIAGTLVIYHFFPRLLFYIVYEVHESVMYDNQRQIKTVPPCTQYTETFSPRGSYLKSIVLHLGRAPENKDSAPEGAEEYVAVVLREADGITLAEDKISLADGESSALREFSLEKSLEAYKQFQLLITFPDHSTSFVTFGPETMGPSEHISLLENDSPVHENIYIQYIYGTYSKKLLTLWFLAFFVTAFLTAEWVRNRFRMPSSSARNASS